MKKIISSEVLVAFSRCPRLAYLLLCTKKKGNPNEYVRILQQQMITNQRQYISALKLKNPDIQPYTAKCLNNGSDFLVNATLQAEGLEAGCGLLTRVKGSSALGRYGYEPTIFVGTYTVYKEQRLEVMFIGHILEKILKKPPITGRIIKMDGRSLKVTLKDSSKALIPLLEPLQGWVNDTSPEAPPIILNKHCPMCSFQSLCKNISEQEDNLSLLDRVTPKVVRKYERKGIFTIKQLSYLYRPRKSRKRGRNQLKIAHKIELQALAIRTGKIYLKELPGLTRQPVELFLDIEGVPDLQLYYLIGLLVCEAGNSTYYSFWADITKDEGQIWQQFLEKMNHYPCAPIYHYGSYEPRAIAKLARRYETNIEGLEKRLCNINNHIYGKVYFPVRSNSLKEIGKFIGATWTSPDASGLQSLVWRYYWDVTRNVRYQERLLTYNKEDCQALKLLSDKLSKIKQSADKLSDVDFTDQPKRHATENRKLVHSQFDTILIFAHTSYDKRKIQFRKEKKEKNEENKEKKVSGAKKGYHGHRKKKLKPTKIIQVPQRKHCPKCENELLRPTRRISKRLIINVILMGTGIKKNTIEYIGVKGHCPKCHRYYLPAGITKYHKNQLYDHGFKAWITYQRIALRQSYGSIIESLEEQFKEKVPVSRVQFTINNLGKYYKGTEKSSLQHILESPFIHADETVINIKGVDQYVWVFTDGKYVIFQKTKTREATIVHEFLTDYNGILVSDFYPGYDSVRCRQQKCWVHLIRDLNNDLWFEPFDSEFEVFVMEIRNMFIPIMEAVKKYGLKKRNLKKFKNQVNKFYTKAIIDKQYKSEVTLKYQKRFIRYNESLFTFLEQDGIPWHNNTAENAIRHLAIQRDISTYFSESVIHDYLRLLGIRQTCRFQDKSFFKFLFSGETDIDQFERSKRSRRT
jgi:predicted RecB family nuclease